MKKTHLVCLHALIFVKLNESDLISDSESSVSVNPEFCNLIHINIYKYSEQNFSAHSRVHVQNEKVTVIMLLELLWVFINLSFFIYLFIF